MKTLFAALWGLTVCYLGLMLVYRLKEFRTGLQIIRIVAFFLAWGCVASLIAPVWKIYSLFSDVIERPDVASLFEMFGIFILSSLLAKVMVDHPEWHDYAHIGPFLRDSLLFRHPGRLSVNLFEEVEKEEMRRLHVQQTGKELDLPNELERSAGKPFAGKSVKPLKYIPVQEAQFAEHQKQLDAGERVDLTDAYRLFILRIWKEQEPDQIFHMGIDPMQRLLTADLLMKGFHPRDRLNADRFFRFRQDMYEELQRVAQLPLLRPYSSFYGQIELRGFRPDEDGFGNPVQIPCFRLRMDAAELKLREGKMFIATELDRLADLTWLNEEN